MRSLSEMKVLHAISELAAIDRPLHLAIGVFDGLHLGHRAVIDAAFRSAADTGGMTAVATFDPHPGRVLSTGQRPAVDHLDPTQVALARWHWSGNDPGHSFRPRIFANRPGGIHSSVAGSLSPVGPHLRRRGLAIRAYLCRRCRIAEATRRRTGIRRHRRFDPWRSAG